MFPDPTVSETYTVVKGLEKPQENPMRKTPGKIGPSTDKKAARKMRSHPRQEMSEERRRPRRAPRLFETSPLTRLPTKPPKLGEDPIHDCCSTVRLSEALWWTIFKMDNCESIVNQDHVYESRDFATS